MQDPDATSPPPPPLLTEIAEEKLMDHVDDNLSSTQQPRSRLSVSTSEYNCGDPANSTVAGSPDKTPVGNRTSVPSMNVFAQYSQGQLPTFHSPPQKVVKGLGKSLNIKGVSFTQPLQGSGRELGTLSVLDLAALDLDHLKRSFLAHAHVFSRADMADLYKLSGNVARELMQYERQQERIQRRRLLHRNTRQRQADSRKDSVSTASDGGESVYGVSVTSITEAASATAPESLIPIADFPYQRMRMLRTWLYDRLVQWCLDEYAKTAKTRRRDSLGARSAFTTNSFLGVKGKSSMSELWGPPMPSKPQGFDMYDTLSDRLLEREPSLSMALAEVTTEELLIPLPVFAYVFARAIFRLCFLDRFPSKMFSPTANVSFSATPETSIGEVKPDITTPTTATATAAATGTATTSSGTKGGTSNTNADTSIPIVYHDSGLMQEVGFLLEECRRTVIHFFEILDPEQKGVISWSAFTDLLMEQVEAQHRILKLKESSEENAHNDARVFDEYVLEPFPSVMQRLGYIGAVTEVRRSESIIIVEGANDFAVCDSSYSGLIQHKLLVRTADVLFAHRQGAPEEWGAERWDAVTDTVTSPIKNKKFNGKFLRYEDGRRNCDESAEKLLRDLRGNVDPDAIPDSDDMNRPGDGERIDRRTKPSIESALQVEGVAPNLPKVLVTLHNDLTLRLFNMDQHLWLVPETITISCVETITAMDWCTAGPNGDPALKTILFIGTRSGEIYRVDMQAILQRIVAAKVLTGDMMSTGIAATSTVRCHLEPFILQRSPIHKEFITSLCLTPTGVLLSSSLDGTVVLSRTNNLSQLRSFRADRDAGVRFACITPLRSAILTLTTGNRVSLWGNTQHSSSLDLYDPVAPHYFPIISVKVDESLEQIITVDSSGHAKVWNLRSGLAKTSFYAVSDQGFTTFHHLYSDEQSTSQKGHRLFDVDESEKKRPRLLHDARNQRDVPLLLQTTSATIDAANKAMHLHPARYVAYDSSTKRLFVTGARNNVVCVFVGGATAVKAHSAPLLHITACQRNRWIISVSVADCRVWQYQSGNLVLGIKANNPEFIMARMMPVMDHSVGSPTSAQLAAATEEAERHTLDACKQPQPTLGDVMRIVSERADAQRRNRSAKRFSLGSSIGEKDTFQSGGVSHRLGNGGEGKRAHSTGSTNRNSTGITSTLDGGSLADDVQKNQGISYRIVCAHVDSQERFIFYALNNGDIRVHRTDSGRLSKTFVTVPPSSELIFAAVLQCRHLFASSRHSIEHRNSLTGEDGEVTRPLSSGTPIKVQDIAFILHRLLRHEKKLPLQQGESNSIHKEAIGMMTSKNSDELSVVYADGVIRFFPLIGNGVQAQRLIIPEFLVSKALSYLRLDGFLQRKIGASSNNDLTAFFSKDQDSSNEPQLNFIVEADAVSFITVSSTLDLVCIVQVNGRVSVMDTTTPVGTIIHVFNMSGEVTAVSFLGAYPCLVVADAQGGISFFLVKGSSMLGLLEDFVKAVSLHHRKQQRQQQQQQVQQSLGETIGQTNDKKLNTNSGGEREQQQQHQQHQENSAASMRMWWFRTSGTPAVLHFDPMLCTLYIGTSQGHVSSYLVRNLILAFDLIPVVGSSLNKGKSTDAHFPNYGNQCSGNEQQVCNLLLVFFGITPERVMTYLEAERASSFTQWRGTKAGTSQKKISVSWRTVDQSQSQSQYQQIQQRSPVASVAYPSTPFTPGATERVPSAGPPKMWRSSLSWVYESCRPLFYSSSLTPAQKRSDNIPIIYDLATVTLSDLLIGAAILHHTLRLLAMKRNTSTSGSASKNKMEGGNEETHVPPAVTLSQNELRLIRKCIAEEILYRNEFYFDQDQSHSTPNDQLMMSCNIEEEVDMDTPDNYMDIFSSTITVDWVEFLFRRHVSTTISNSPLTLLSLNGALERARYERRERARLLRLEVEIEEEQIISETSGVSAQRVLQNPFPTTIAVDCDAFLEGTSRYMLDELLRRRRHRRRVDIREEDTLCMGEGEGVRCITTQRNGLVFVGSSDGSITLWSPYVCARLQDLHPGMLLEESIRKLGEAVKLQIAQKVDRVVRRRQRQAYAAASDDAKVHENMMHNLDVKYKVATMRRDSMLSLTAGWPGLSKNNRSSSGSISGGNSAAMTQFQLTGDNGISEVKTISRGSLSRAQSFQGSVISSSNLLEKERALLEKEKELLLAVLNITPSMMTAKGILLEDLCFLPLQMSMLSELEDFNVEAYAAAVKFAVARLIREFCLNMNSISHNNDDDDGDHEAVLSGAYTNGMIDPRLNTRWGYTAPRDSDGTNLCDDTLGFYLAAHDRVISAFYADQRQLQEEKVGCMASRVMRNASRDSRMFHNLHNTERRLSPGGLNANTGSVNGKNTTNNNNNSQGSVKDSQQNPTPLAWFPSFDRTLPAYARAGGEEGNGAINVSVSLRREKGLCGCMGLDVQRLAGVARWLTAEEAMQLIVSRGDGLLRAESFSLLQRALNRGQTGHTGRGESLFADSENVRGCHVGKVPMITSEPLLLPATEYGVEEKGPLDSTQNQPLSLSQTQTLTQHQQTQQQQQTRQRSDSHSTADSKSLGKGLTISSRSDEGSSGNKERAKFFLTEADDDPATLHLAASGGASAAAAFLMAATAPAIAAMTTSSTSIMTTTSFSPTGRQLHNNNHNNNNNNTPHPVGGGGGGVGRPKPPVVSLGSSLSTMDCDENGAGGAVRMQWSLPSKEYSHRAQLARTGRTAAPRPQQQQQHGGRSIYRRLDKTAPTTATTTTATAAATTNLNSNSGHGNNSAGDGRRGGANRDNAASPILEQRFNATPLSPTSSLGDTSRSGGNHNNTNSNSHRQGRVFVTPVNEGNYTTGTTTTTTTTTSTTTKLLPALPQQRETRAMSVRQPQGITERVPTVRRGQQAPSSVRSRKRAE